MEQQEQNQTRRGFFVGLGVVGALILAAGFFIKNVFLYLFPEKKAKTYHKYLVAKEGEIPIGKAKEISIDGKPVFVVRMEDGYRVFSGVCTHLGCIIRWEEQNNRFYCPCHAGIFSRDGEVIGGPPPRPLDQFEVELDKNLIFVRVQDKKEGPWA